MPPVCFSIYWNYLLKFNVMNMKIIIFLFLSISFWTFEAIAQKQPFKNFKVIDLVEDGEYYTTWIIPMGFEDAFEQLKQECIENKYEMTSDTSLFTADLSKWLDCNLACITPDTVIPKSYNLGLKMLDDKVHGNIDMIARTKYGFLIPENIIKCLEIYAEKKLAKKDYSSVDVLQVYVLVNSDGKPLSTYFEVYKDELRFLEENDLQMMHDSIMKQKFNLEPYRFGYHTQEQIQEFSDMINSKTWRNMDGTSRLEWMDIWEEQIIPSSYGVIEIFRAYYESPRTNTKNNRTNIF